ncbi:MAG: UMP kinase [Deltaproteobacteria bacterium]|nr:UMP kinase [Deltaproteobacteria bacterium]
MSLRRDDALEKGEAEEINMQTETVIISLGGSIIVPNEVDVPFLRRFKGIVDGLSLKQFIIICGGGKVCRNYQHAAIEIADVTAADLDWIGIAATRLNAELVRSVFGKEAHQKVIHDPEERIDSSKRVIVGAGFEPGSSTDLRAVQLAERFGAARVINMSNIDCVYGADPKKAPNAVRLPRISWPDFRLLVGEKWDPGLHMPFDPIASKEAARLGLEVIIIGNDVANLERLLEGKAFEGTIIS